MNEKRNSIIEKVRALFNKANPENKATPAEAASALSKAQELMTKYGIEQMEAEATHDESIFDIGKTEWNTDRSRRNIDSYVFNVLKECFGVDVVFTSYQTPGKKVESVSYVIIGDVLDREMAKFAAPIIYKTMLSGFSAWLKSSGSKWSAAYERSYSYGVYRGYVTASDEGKTLAMKHLSKEKKEQFGLILIGKASLIEDFKTKEFPRITSIKTRRGFGSEQAQQIGFGKGANMKLTPTTKSLANKN